ncbi:MAG: flap endonuclease, partial [Acidimicrobiales bacterium]|nr:flap endonuclease [Acidimicrobiales bacterium]
MEVHLVDGTYELFRYHFALPSHVTADGQEVGAMRGVAGSMLQLLEEGATHVGIATDHVIPSFRNELYGGYKDGSGVEEELVSQFPLVEELLDALGFVVWPMVEYEADDALGSAAAVAAADERVDRVLICTPDKDLGQCVGGKVFQLDRRKGLVSGVGEVTEKFGVPPSSIADYLGLVGDTA